MPLVGACVEFNMWLRSLWYCQNGILEQPLVLTIGSGWHSKAILTEQISTDATKWQQNPLDLALQNPLDLALQPLLMPMLPKLKPTLLLTSSIYLILIPKSISSVCQTWRPWQNQSSAFKTTNQHLQEFASQKSGAPKFKPGQRSNVWFFLLRRQI